MPAQIIDGAGLTEDCECECAYALLNAECRPGGESGEDAYALTLNLLLRARATVWRREEIRFIADLYSTCAELETQRRTPGGPAVRCPRAGCWR
mgnify:CR=1 FL=1